MDRSLSRIRDAYDLTVTQHLAGIDPLSQVPEEFLASEEYRACQAELASEYTGSNAPEIRAFLDPQPGTRFLDAGCCANLANYRFDQWPSLYYGVDISPALTGAMRGLAAQEGLTVGGLEVAEVADLPFDDGFFDLAALIGVLEYVDLEYTAAALRELRRVLKRDARLAVDFPNLLHPRSATVLRLEEYLGRPNIPKTREQFEAILSRLFSVVRVDGSHVMLKYFVTAN